MIKKILFATDLGAYTSHSLIHVEALAKQFDAKVSVVHAVPPMDDFAAAVVQSYCSDQVKQEVLETPNIMGLFDALRDQVFDLLADGAVDESDLMSLVDNIMIAPGQPAAVILHEAERINADLIVIGSHGIDAIDGRMLGSVVSKVLQLAKMPVFMVPMMNPAEVYGLESYKTGSDFRV